MNPTKRERLERLSAQLESAASALDLKRAKGFEPSAAEVGALVAMTNDVRALRAEVAAEAPSHFRGGSIDQLGRHNGSKSFTSSGPNPFGSSIGEAFTTSPEFKGMLDRYSDDGRIPERAKVKMAPVGFKTLITGASLTSGGAFVSPDHTNTFDAGTFARPLTIRDVVTSGTTGSDTVEYLRQTAQTNAAAPVAEATTAVPIVDPITTVEGGLKPESAMTFEKVTASVKTLAHWIPVTRRALADGGQLRTIIDNFLRYGLEEELEDQMISGSGAGENFQGITTLSGIQTHAKSTDTHLDAYRKALTKVGLVGRAEANAYLLHPNDWEEVELLRNQNADYYFGGPITPGAPRLWGLPVVLSEALAEGTGFVGDFRTLVLWDREQATLTASTEHADFFTRNLVAILAEMRAAFGALRPAAIVKITGV